MVSKEKLYAATDDGLRIIEMHYPEAGECARTNKPFKRRPGERTPSARLKKYNGVWKVTDFGGDGRADDPISIHMEITGLKFAEAILDLAQKFNVTDEINRSVNRPDIRKRPAKMDEEDGHTYWDEPDQEFTERECQIMGPRVKPEHLKALHWYRVKRLTSVKNREAVDKYPTENYPIFMRECWFTDSTGKKDRFFKIYEPLNADKGWRFQYQPAGKKPRSYINGLEELAAAFKAHNDREEKAWNTDPANEGKPYKEQKLPEAIICSGERDSLCVRSLGYHPLWFNSETYQVTPEEWKQITRYVETVYNIPDIDATGRLKGTEMALKFIDVHTIWLPEKLQNYRDNRGNPRKDFRDWMEFNKENKDFRDLLELATPAKFWTTTIDKNGRTKYSIDISCLHEFLKLNGFHTLKDDHQENTIFVRIIDNIVKQVKAKDIRNFVIRWVRDTARPRLLRNLVMQDPKLSATSLESLDEVDPDFTNYTETSQFFFFPKFTAEVTGDGILRHEHKGGKQLRYVWNENVIEHNIKFLPDMFEITHPEGHLTSEDFDITVLDHKSNYFRYLINSSRLFWRKELEYGLADLPKDEADRYRATHKFDIAGPNLSPEEIQEQKQCLINKIFTIGYMLHRYKSESRPWAPFAMDNVIGDNDQCNGRSGKSCMFRSLKYLCKWLKLSGRNPKILENKFIFEQVTEHLSLAVIDDCDEYFPFKQFYDNISSDITIDTKNVSAYTLPYNKSPKFAFTSNYVPREFDPSSVGRMLFVVFSDYYHQASIDNDYLETREIRTDFNKDLFGSSYTEEEWEADINFMLQCVKFYLSVAHLPVKIEPKMENIIFRKHLRDMSENFQDWAAGYFSLDSGNLDTEIIREKAFDDYKRFSGVSKITMQKFSKSLKGFVYTCDYIEELNPKELHTSGGRILRRIEDPITHQKVQKEMIYLRSKAEAEKLRNPPPPPPIQEEMPF